MSGPYPLMLPLARDALRAGNCLLWFDCEFVGSHVANPPCYLLLVAFSSAPEGAPVAAAEAALGPAPTLSPRSEASSRKSSCSRSVKLLGIARLTCTSRSPRPSPRTDGMPRPRSLNTRPFWVSAGMVSDTFVPSSVGEATSPPSAATVTGTSTTVRRSLPRNSKRGWGRMITFR